MRSPITCMTLQHLGVSEHFSMVLPDIAKRAMTLLPAPKRLGSEKPSENEIGHLAITSNERINTATTPHVSPRRMHDMTTPPLKISHTVGPTDPPILDLTIGDVLRRAAAERPDQPALIASNTGATWTFVELLSDAEAVARDLVDRFEPHSRIAIWAQNLPEW